MNVKTIAQIGVILGIFVVGLGAYTRLKDAGLGCPDWPSCYGQLIGVPHTPSELRQAAKAYPQAIPVVSQKAWPEVIHRYFAGTLGLIIFALAIQTWRKRQTLAKPTQHLMIGLLILLGIQAVLGMWTVTLLLMPLVVMSHLIGGMLITCGLWRYTLWREPTRVARHKPFLILAFFLTLTQIILGGWTSTNYAALICPDFPTCFHQWWPTMDFHHAFPWLSPLGVNYEGGVLSTAARVAIQMLHRFGALVVGLYLLSLGTYITWKQPHERVWGMALLVLLSIQISLGILNVFWQLPLSIAVGHNVVALGLLLTITRLITPPKIYENDLTRAY